MTVVVNKPLPEFEALATGNESLSNQSLIGQTVVLYFYPKDNTPGCTTEAMQFRDKYKDFVKAGATVYGPKTSMIRARVFSPTGTDIGALVRSTFNPLFKPSVVPMAIALTIPSPSCC